MPKFFVCTRGPVGAILIEFTGSDAKACSDFIDTKPFESQNDFYVYEQVDIVALPG